MISQIEMGRRKRRRPRKRVRPKKSVAERQEQLALEFKEGKNRPKANENLNLTGRFRLIKTLYGPILLVQTTKNGKFVQPTKEQVQYLIEKRLIHKDTGSMVPIK